MEIIILNFCNYEKNVRESIIDRERIDVEIANSKERNPSKIEIEINDGYTFEV